MLSRQAHQALTADLHWHGRVRSVSEDNINVVHLQPGQRVVQPLDQVLPRQPSRIEVLSAGTEEDLGGDDQVGSLPSTFLDDSAHLDFRVSLGVAFSRVEHVDTWSGL